MPKYFTEVDRWISHECRLVKAGETFETTFPGGIKLKEGDTLREIKAEKPKREKADKPETPSDKPETPADDPLT